MAFLELADVRKVFNQSVAVEHFTMGIEPGEFVSFLGPSGCGKTTTLRMVAGFERPTSGTISVGGVDITHRPANRRNIGMVFQSYALFPNMTVAENIGFGLKLKHVDSKSIAQRVSHLLEVINLPDKGGRYPAQLSGGQQQRVALARALAIEPQVLLLDEPLSALDAKIRVSLRNEIRAIQRQFGITTIYVTHDQEEALSLSDRIVVMSNGRVEQIGTPLQIYTYPQTTFVASFVGTLNVLRAKVIDPAAGRITVDDQPVMVARSLAQHRAGDMINVALRPEVIGLDGAPGTINQLQGVVEQVTFLGGTIRTQMRFASNSLFFDMFNTPNGKLPQTGQTLTVTFPEASCLLIDGPVGTSATV
ncbi:MAG: ABC transporter ATP-binding protein [Herpetosiphonaceae bacterium]|nr:ABC transporter ATP-binding protein [Herpetosiphonaceae bacterium]